MCNEMVSAFEMLDLDDRVKAIVVTGKGRMFCAGADLINGLHRGRRSGTRSIRMGKFVCSFSFWKGRQVWISRRWDEEAGCSNLRDLS